MDRGKIMTAEMLEAGKDFGRYLDVDGDGIPYRTLPGTHPKRGAYFTRGTTKDRYARYSEEGPVYVDNMDRLLKKFATAKTLVPAPELREGKEPAKAGVIYFGSTTPPMDEALDHFAEQGIALDALRLKGFPFADSVYEFIARHDQIFVVEQNRDAQLRSLIVNEGNIDPARADPGAELRRDADHRAIHRRRDLGKTDRGQCHAVPQEGARAMTYIAKPKFHHPKLATNKLGFTHRDYEGSVSTLCAGCGHDSISAAIIEACFELDLPPHRIAKLSGIGCSSKTPTYFLGQSHGFNSVHGRMPSVLTGANLANRDLIYFGVSGDGDSASIGLGQFAHSIRRGVNMVYIVENNGVYGLTKGQFSATADKGSQSKRGVANTDEPIDLASMAILLGASFVARGFSGDKAQLVPLIKAAIEHKGAAFLDIISPCVAFNNHPGSTKSYEYVREHNEAVNSLDFMVPREPITADYQPGTVERVTQHDGSVINLRKLDGDYDLHDRSAAIRYVGEREKAGEVVTGLLYLDPDAIDLHAHLNTVEMPLNVLDDAALIPGAEALDKFNRSLR